MSDYRKLSRQPLKVVIAEIRYSDIMNIYDYIPRFQDSIRNLFPIVREGSRQEVQAVGNEIKVIKKTTFSFLSSDKSSGVEIGDSRIVYFTKSYNRFNGFNTSLSEVLRLAEEYIKPALLYRIGLRYSNTINVEKKQALNDYFEKDFKLPLKVGKSGEVIIHKTETQAQTDQGLLLIRRMAGKTSRSIFPDLETMPIEFEKTKNQLKVYLDIDHSYDATDENIEFNNDFILSKFEQLHETVRSSFWAMTTKLARDEKWS